MGKRGISTVVAAVLVILISVALITIVWVTTSELIEDNLEFEDVSSRVDVVTNGGYTVYDPDLDIIFVQIERVGDEPMDALMIYINFDGDTHSEIVEAPLPNSRKTYNFTLLNFDSPPQSISVAPIVFEGNTPVIGDASAKIIVPTNAISPDAFDLDSYIPNFFGDQNDFSLIPNTDGLGGGEIPTGSDFECLNDSERACDVTDGVGICEYSQEFCVDGYWDTSSCIYPTNYEGGIELTCNDYLDNDCDGFTDSIDSDCDFVPSLEPIFYLPFDGPIANGSYDATGNFQLIINGSPSPNLEGVVDGSYDFNLGNGGDRIEIVGQVVPEGSKTISYGGWFNFSSNLGPVYNKPTPFSQEGGYGFRPWVFLSFYSGWDWRCFYGACDPTPRRSFLISCNNHDSDKWILIEDWYHVMCVSNETHKELYINGVLESNGGIGDLTISNSPFVFGGIGSGPYVGSIDDFRIYNRMINASEVLELYDAGNI